MINQLDLKRFYFELNDQKPIQIIVNQHGRDDEGWFDMHYELELGVITKGRMKREFFGHEMEIGAGEVWLCNMWEPHGFEISEAPCEVVVFVIDPRYLAHNQFLNQDVMAAFLAHPNHRPQASEKVKAEVLELANKVNQHLNKHGEVDWAKLYLFQILLLLMEGWKVPEKQEERLSKESIHEALKLIFDERRLITTEEAASVCHMSVTNFRKQFKDLMGATFSEFALQYRVKGAAAQLKNSELTQEAVAINWGFTDASHLHKYLNRS